ncbi:hypothetical protein THAOC_27243, partial [Thalassiosira oceanica]
MPSLLQPASGGRGRSSSGTTALTGTAVFSPGAATLASPPSGGRGGRGHSPSGLALALPKYCKSNHHPRVRRAADRLDPGAVEEAATTAVVVVDPTGEAYRCAVNSITVEPPYCVVWSRSRKRHARDECRGEAGSLDPRRLDDAGDVAVGAEISWSNSLLFREDTLDSRLGPGSVDQQQNLGQSRREMRTSLAWSHSSLGRERLGVFSLLSAAPARQHQRPATMQRVQGGEVLRSQVSSECAGSHRRADITNTLTDEHLLGTDGGLEETSQAGVQDPQGVPQVLSGQPGTAKKSHASRRLKIRHVQEAGNVQSSDGGGPAQERRAGTLDHRDTGREDGALLQRMPQERLGARATVEWTSCPTCGHGWACAEHSEEYLRTRHTKE